MNKQEEKVPVLSVTELTKAIKLQLEEGFPSVWLQGEISNCKLHSSGHLYFSLKDSDAQISAVMFRGHASSLKTAPKNGDSVLVHGNINVYPPSGRYQIVVDTLRLAGIGELLQRLEELKQKLHKRGWFKKEHKKPLPKFPKKIGVVTSPTGAAIQDILNILSRRFAGFHLIINPVKVQGDGAAQEIAAAIEQFNHYDLVDVMIVGRGGGSIEDLFAFNEEAVAEAIFNSRIPIVAAVGHETDHCIAEYVADMRAPTPSAAAEIVLAEKTQLLEHLKQSHSRIRQTILHLLRHDKRRLEGILKQPIFQTPYALLGPWMQRLDNIKQQADLSVVRKLREQKHRLSGYRKVLSTLSPTARIGQFNKQLASLNSQIDSAIQRQIKGRRERLEHRMQTLKAIDPKALLGKGYSILFSEKEGSVINSVNQVKENQEVRFLLTDGEALATINTLFPHEQRN